MGENSERPQKVRTNGYQPQNRMGAGYKPTGQRGYQPQSDKPLDPMKLTRPTGGSAVQPSNINGYPGNSAPQK